MGDIPHYQTHDYSDEEKPAENPSNPDKCPPSSVVFNDTPSSGIFNPGTVPEPSVSLTSLTSQPIGKIFPKDDKTESYRKADGKPKTPLYKPAY